MEYKQRRQRGFTLVELMITVAIVGILSSIAIPSYTIFLSRARVVEGLNLANSAKTAVAEAFNHTGSVPDQASTGYISTGTDIISTITVSNDGLGIVTVTYTPTVFNIVIQLTPRLNIGQAITWNCSTLDSGDNIYVPSECRL